jgi:hypothetical protein
MKLKQIQNNEWETPIYKGYILECCKCGLRHKIDFRINNKGQIEFKANRII